MRSPTSDIAPAPDPATRPEAGQDFVIALRGRDFSAFYVEARPNLVRALAVTVGDRDLAVEAVDEAMVRAFQRWSRVGHMDNPGGWVYRVAVNWATSVLRRHRRALSHRRIAGPDNDVQVPPPVASDPEILAAVAELDLRQRAVVVCRYLLGLSEAETAEALSIPPGTAKSRLFRANRLLSDRLSHLREDQD